VDGIFFDANTDKKTIQNIENYLTDLGYKYKYEDVQDFKMNVDERKLSLRMIKNGDIKVYTVGKDNVGESIKKYINDQIKKQDQTPTINKI
jgi:endonuclease YncB( thermonuclease family)